MGYVYDGMYRAIDGIKNFKDKKKFLEPYVKLSRIVRILNSIEIFMLQLIG